MEYTLFRPKNCSTWYYFYYNESGTRIRKTTKCDRKADAQAFIDRLEYEDKLREANRGRVLFCDYARDFFIRDGAIDRRWIEHGKQLKTVTMRGYRVYLEQYLLPWFGDMFLGDIDAKTLDAHLLDARKLDRYKRGTVMPLVSGSTKNEICNTLVIILREALFDKKISAVPVFKKFKRNSKSQNTLTSGELYELFPFDTENFGRVWTSQRYMNDRDSGTMFATMGAVAGSCGLRSGEVCALCMDQIIPGKGIVIDKSTGYDGEFDLPKSGKKENPRFRVIPVSDYTFTILNRWLAIRGDAPGRVFQYHGHAVDEGMLLKRFKVALAAIGIDTKERRITFHGLRYTFDSKLKLKLDRSLLHEIIGHTNDRMTDHYDRPILEERLDELRVLALPAMNEFWGREA